MERRASVYDSSYAVAAVADRSHGLVDPTSTKSRARGMWAEEDDKVNSRGAKGGYRGQQSTNHTAKTDNWVSDCKYCGNAHAKGRCRAYKNAASHVIGLGILLGCVVQLTEIEGWLK